MRNVLTTSSPMRNAVTARNAVTLPALPLRAHSYKRALPLFCFHSKQHIVEPNPNTHAAHYTLAARYTLPSTVPSTLAVTW